MRNPHLPAGMLSDRPRGGGVGAHTPPPPLHWESGPQKGGHPGRPDAPPTKNNEPPPTSPLGGAREVPGESRDFCRAQWEQPPAHVGGRGMSSYPSPTPNLGGVSRGPGRSLKSWPWQEPLSCVHGGKKAGFLPTTRRMRRPSCPARPVSAGASENRRSTKTQSLRA